MHARPMIGMSQVKTDGVRQINIDLVDQPVRLPMLAEGPLSLARVLGPSIRVNVVCPGFIEGEWLKEGLGEDGYERARAAARKGAPLGVTATAETVADSILYFISGPQIVTGESMIVDGGRHLGMTPLTRR